MDAFVETTAIVDLLFKEKERVRKVQAVLRDYATKYSSQYVRMEIKRGVLQYYVSLYNKAVECRTLSEVFAYIQRLAAGPQRNRLGTILEAITNFFQKIEDRELRELKGTPQLAEFQKKMLEAFLRRRVRRFWHAFEKQVDVVIDTVECYKNIYTLKPPQLVGDKFDNTFDNCDKYKPGICRIREFFNEKEPQFVSIREQLGEAPSPDSETQKRLRAIREILRVKKKQILRKHCWWAGDAILVLEAPENAVIVNHNCKHFDPLCRAVGRTSVCY